MKKIRFSEEQISEILSKADSGTPINMLCNMHHITHDTYYKWRGKYKGLTASELKLINHLEHKNRMLKRLYNQAVQQKEILQRAIEGKL